MKNKLYIFIVLLAVGLLTSGGCSSDDSDFTGEDCYFVSFSLTVDGVVYPAKISDNKILLEIPYGIDISQAQVNYSLNENATVLPDPTSVKDWKADQLFRVQAYNHNFSSFTYSFSYTDVAANENVILLTQADVDEFAGKNINKIDGNLIIGEKVSSVSEEDAITDLSGLSGLTSVNYNIVINNSYAGSDTEGLSNLKKTGGFYIGSTANGAEPVKRIKIALPNLESIGNFIVNSDSVTAISLPKVREISDLYIGSQFLADIELPNLQNCYGNFVMTGSHQQQPSTQHLNRSLNAILLPKLSTVSGNFLLNNFTGLSVTGIGSLQTIYGNCEIKSLGAIELINFPLLQRVDGDFIMNGNTAITKIVAPELISARSIDFSNGNSYAIKVKDIILSKLTNVQKGITLAYLECEKIELPMLEDAGESLVLQTAPNLLSFTAPRLTNCKSIRFTAINLLKSSDFSKVENLEKTGVYTCGAMERFSLPKVISGNLTISNSGNNDSFIDFGNLESIEGTFSVESFTKPNLEIKKIKKVGTISFTRWNSDIESVSFPSLTECGDLTINSFDVIESLSIPLLAEAQSFSIIECPVLDNIAVPLLKKIEGQLKLQGARWSDKYIITNLDNFAALTSVGSVSIQYARRLNDFTGLKNVVTGLESDNWMVSDCEYNPTLQDMKDGKYTN